MAKITFETEVPELLTYAEAAEILGMTRPNIYNLIDNGQLHRIKIGSSCYVLRNEVELLKQEPK